MSGRKKHNKDEKSQKKEMISYRIMPRRNGQIDDARTRYDRNLKDLFWYA